MLEMGTESYFAFAQMSSRSVYGYEHHFQNVMPLLTAAAWRCR
jgi:hypothetical protein